MKSKNHSRVQLLLVYLASISVVLIVAASLSQFFYHLSVMLGFQSLPQTDSSLTPELQGSIQQLINSPRQNISTLLTENALQQKKLNSRPRVQRSLKENVVDALDCNDHNGCIIQEGGPEILLFSVCVSDAGSIGRKLNTISMVSMLMHSTLHDMSVVIVTENLSSLHARWGKVDVAKKLMNGVPAEQARNIMYMDCDTVFANPNLDPYVNMVKAMEPANMMIANHVYRNNTFHDEVCLNLRALGKYECTMNYEDECSKYMSCVPNTGTWILKNCDVAKQLLTFWLGTFSKGDKSPGVFWMNKDIFLYDQGAFIKHVMLSEFQHQVKLISATSVNYREIPNED
eukprot:Awhi_evm1s1024